MYRDLDIVVQSSTGLYDSQDISAGDSASFTIANTDGDWSNASIAIAVLKDSEVNSYSIDVVNTSLGPIIAAGDTYLEEHDSVSFSDINVSEVSGSLNISVATKASAASLLVSIANVMVF